jgi:hypothetical protein
MVRTSTKLPAILACLLSAFILLSTILSVSLDSGLVSTVTVNLGNIGVNYDCTLSTGMFTSGVITGESCPVNSSGKSTKSAVCHDGSTDQVTVENGDCGLLKAAQGCAIVAIFFAAIAFVFLTLQLFMFMEGVNYRTFLASSVLVGLSGLFEFVTFVIYEARSNDDEDGWADTYGCHNGAVKFIFNLQGQTCTYRGAAYAFMVCVWVFSFILAALLAVKGRQMRTYTKGDTYDDSRLTNDNEYRVLDDKPYVGRGTEEENYA